MFFVDICGRSDHWLDELLEALDHVPFAVAMVSDTPRFHLTLAQLLE
jgi:hypothetical protein